MQLLLLCRCRGYFCLYLPSCGLAVGELCQLVAELRAAHINLSYGGLVVAIPHSDVEQGQLEGAAATAGYTLKW